MITKGVYCESALFGWCIDTHNIGWESCLCVCRRVLFDLLLTKHFFTVCGSQAKVY